MPRGSFGLKRALVFATVVLVGCGASSTDAHDVSVRAEPETTTSVIRRAVASGGTNVAPDCSVTAVGTALLAVDARFPPAEAPPEGTNPQTRPEAIETARWIPLQSGVTGSAPPDAPVAASEISYGAFLEQSRQPGNPTVNRSRCVWVVTIHAPYAVKPPPMGRPAVLDVYSVVSDVATGIVISVDGGLDFFG